MKDEIKANDDKSISHRLSKAEGLGGMGYFRKLKLSEKTQIVLSIFGSMFGLGIYNHPKYFLETGVVGYLIACIFAFVINHLAYVSMVELADKYGYKNYAEIAKFLGNPIYIKIMNVFFMVGYIFRLFGPFILINDTINGIAVNFGNPNALLDCKYSIFGIVLTGVVLIPMIAQRKLGKITAAIYLSITAYILINVFTLVARSSLPAIKNPDERNWLIDFGRFPNTFFYMISASSIHGNVMMIYNDLSYKKIQTMKKVLYISFSISSFIYPLYSAVGSYMLLKICKIKNLTSFTTIIREYFPYSPSFSMVMSVFNILISLNAFIFAFIAFRNTFLSFFVPKNSNFDDFVSNSMIRYAALFLVFFFVILASVITFLINDFTIGIQLNAFLVNPVLYCILPLIVIHKQNNSVVNKALIGVCSLLYCYTIYYTIKMLFFK